MFAQEHRPAARSRQSRLAAARTQELARKRVQENARQRKVTYRPHATLRSVMPDMIEGRRNWDLWLGFLLALGAPLCNAAFFVNPPGQRAIPWLSVLLAGVALIFLVRGLQRAFGQPKVYRGKILNSILALVSLLLVGVAIFSFFQARAIPASAGAPKVGQKAPDFTLADTSGQRVSLAQLFTPAADDSQAIPPKAVLLIFYRGYW